MIPSTKLAVAAAATTTRHAILRAAGGGGVDHLSFNTMGSRRSHYSTAIMSTTTRQYICAAVVGTTTVPLVSPLSSSSSSLVSSSSNILSSFDHRRWFSDKPSDDEGEANGAGEEAAAGAETKSSSAEEEVVVVDETAQKLEALEGEVKSLKDQLLRSLAEQENIRNIARRDVDAAKQFSIKSFAKSLLEVADNLDRALETATSTVNDGTTQNNNVESFLEGIQLTSTGLIKALESNGVSAFCEQPGDSFDPTTMNALMEYPDPNGEPGKVGQVIKKGYMLNGRILRPAEVGVIKK